MNTTAKPAATHQNEAAQLFVAANPHALIISAAQPKTCRACGAGLSRCWTLLHGWVFYCGVCRVREAAMLTGFTRSRTTGKRRVFAKRTRWRPPAPESPDVGERLLF
ncbi:MAG TPA: hypothetical protein VLV89_10355 [Candidatus Acidoferrum sp.]|nr:hypothetical protein [Candidatus Acidoferrum sp.]